MTENVINLGGAGGQRPGAAGQDGASIGGGVGGKGSLGPEENDEVSPETMALLAIAAEMRRLHATGDASFDVAYDFDAGVVRVSVSREYP